MNKKRLIGLILIFMLVYNNLFAVCRTDLMKGISEMLRRVNWHCMFPIRIAGVKIDPFKTKTKDEPDIKNVLNKSLGQFKGSGEATPVVEADKADRGVFCRCKSWGRFSTPFGIRVGFWEPARVIEIVKDSWCFPFLKVAMGGGINVSGTENLKQKELKIKFKKNGIANLTKDKTYLKSFWQVHFYVFPVLAILDILTDFICLEQSPMSIAYISEVDPRWNDSELSALLNPEALLFANPVAILGCIPDVIAGNMQATIDTLYWCQGQWGTIYPLTGYATGTSFLQMALRDAGRVLFLLHKQFSLTGTTGKKALCKTYIMPIWKKSQYRWQLMNPKKDRGCRTIGEPSYLWETGKNPPSVKKLPDNFAIMLWRKRDCCAR